MSFTVVTRCNQCGEDVTDRQAIQMQAPQPPARVGLFTEIQLAREPLDFCSWACVEAYATSRVLVIA